MLRKVPSGPLLCLCPETLGSVATKLVGFAACLIHGNTPYEAGESLSGQGRREQRTEISCWRFLSDPLLADLTPTNRLREAWVAGPPLPLADTRTRSSRNRTVGGH